MRKSKMCSRKNEREKLIEAITEVIMAENRKLVKDNQSWTKKG